MCTVIPTLQLNVRLEAHPSCICICTPTEASLGVSRACELPDSVEHGQPIDPSIELDRSSFMFSTMITITWSCGPCCVMSLDSASDGRTMFNLMGGSIFVGSTDARQRGQVVLDMSQ